MSTRTVRHPKKSTKPAAKSGPPPAELAARLRAEAAEGRRDICGLLANTRHLEAGSELDLLRTVCRLSKSFRSIEAVAVYLESEVQS